MQLIIGAGGLSKQALSDLRENNKKTQKELVFLDNVNRTTSFFGHRVINNLYDIEPGFDFVICIGAPKWREHYHEVLTKGHNANPITVISKNSNIYPKIVEGNLILSYTLIEPDVKMGTGNLLNCYASIFHDVEVGNFNEIMPGAKILGGAKIGSKCRIGSNSTILPEVKICSNVVIGAGAVVNRDINSPGTYVGIPAKRIKDK